MIKIFIQYIGKLKTFPKRDSQPPKNIWFIRNTINKIEQYSPKKK